MIEKIKKEILNGNKITFEDALRLTKEPIDSICLAANEIRLFYCKNNFDICAIINGKSGGCSENCKYCAQSIYNNAIIDNYPLLDLHTITNAAENCHKQGILRFSVVTSGRKLNNNEIDTLSNVYSKIRDKCKISLCASHGLLDYNQLLKIKNAGVSRYHNNLETSRNFFNKICTTHTYDEKIETIKNAQKAGLEVCSGGIIGLGETIKDRIELAFELKKLKIKSTPINILNPIPGTPLENISKISYDEIKQTIAIFRFILPDTIIRIAGGRGLLKDKGESLIKSGANALITGDMLTTTGISVENDKKMIQKNGGIIIKEC